MFHPRSVPPSLVDKDHFATIPVYGQSHYLDTEGLAGIRMAPYGYKRMAYSLGTTAIGAGYGFLKRARHSRALPSALAASIHSYHADDPLGHNVVAPTETYNTGSQDPFHKMQGVVAPMTLYKGLHARSTGLLHLRNVVTSGGDA